MDESRIFYSHAMSVLVLSADHSAQCFCWFKEITYKYKRIRYGVYVTNIIKLLEVPGLKLYALMYTCDDFIVIFLYNVLLFVEYQFFSP